VLVRVTRTGRGVVLRQMLRVAGALRSVADQVQGAEDPMAEEQRADEQQGKRPSARHLHRCSDPTLLNFGDCILPFGRDDSSSTICKESLLFVGRSVGSTDVLSAPMSGSSVEDCVAATDVSHDEYCRLGWPILINLVAVVPTS
jgi:hypothetical protein